ncbi:uncharacterized protein CC84DRAFT_631060 [Paraphaeosphaeria sporulosa]|uniref:Uncharacterized protein n=1 Tax=Paraphaeosphaeria sporulosa TaxID=1460663 RepID=A0A177CH87_9PLEO|nr:uncharacterized protein CC84DRAFT_631060 [Paraphaeosphaeria sporulosa]OAG06935.1 hypothetical protein CC84DRAFT_631060 [Paraphaeosphaeria sporulosa]
MPLFEPGGGRTLQSRFKAEPKVWLMCRIEGHTCKGSIGQMMTVRGCPFVGLGKNKCTLDMRWHREALDLTDGRSNRKADVELTERVTCPHRSWTLGSHAKILLVCS